MSTPIHDCPSRPRSMRCGFALLASFLLAGSALAVQGTPRLGGPISSAASTETLDTKIANAWFSKRGGRIARASSPRRPAVLLVHGLHSSADDTWLRPSTNMFSDAGKITSALDWRHHPEKKKVGERKYPGVGIWKIGTSEPLPEVDKDNWFDYLKGLDLTVATWSQPGETIADAWPSTLEAFRHLERTTEGPMLLIGHSRGGLLIRKLLKQGGDVSRVRMVVTLCSPHRGSELGNAWGEIAGEIVDLSPGLFWEWAKQMAFSVSPGLREKLKQRVAEVLEPLNEKLLAPGSVELDPSSKTMRDLAKGEKAKTWIEYHTFGGVNANYVRFYAWAFDAMSAVPQYRVKNGKPQQYFVWRIKPHEIKPLSPFLAKLRNVSPEVVPGKGDGLVTDARARLPFPAFKQARHETFDLNHAEVLWSRMLQMKVGLRIANLLERLAEEERAAQGKGKHTPRTKPLFRRG